MGTQAAGNAQVDSRSRAPEEVVRAVDAALDAARALAERSRMPFDGDLAARARPPGGDLDADPPRARGAAVAAGPPGIETTRAAAAR